MKKVLIPYSFLPPQILQKLAKSFKAVGRLMGGFFPRIKLQLKQAEISIDSVDYLTMSFFSSSFLFLITLILSLMVFAKTSEKSPLIPAAITALLLTLFVFMQQLMYPRVRASKKVKGIERNLLPALQNMLIELNAGVPLFNIMVSISQSNYGEVSKEFRKVVNQINTGTPQIKALEESAVSNPSIFYRRTIWQLVNGMKGGAEISKVIQESIDLLSDEQLLQVQKYGSQLNPLAMFYMLVAVIMPSLGMTFLIIISSFIKLSETGTKMIFWSLLTFVIIFQFMFLGIIKSKRPNLMGD